MNKGLWFLLGLLAGMIIGSWPASAAEFGIAEETSGSYIKAVEGEIYVALIETKYSIDKQRTQASATIRVHDHLHKPVEGVKIIVEWSTRNGKTNYCTTRANGECTLRNETPVTRKPKPILLKVITLDHPTLSYFSEEGWGKVWVIQPIQPQIVVEQNKLEVICD